MRRASALLLVLSLVAAPALGQDAGRADGQTLRGEARRATADAERLRRRLVELARAQSGEERGVSSARERLRALNAQETALTARMARNRAELARLLGGLQLYTRDPPPPLMVSPRSATDAVRAAILMRAVTPELERRGRVFAAEAEALSRLRRDAALANADLFAAESALADRRGRIEAVIAEKTALELRLNAEAEAADRAARALAARSSGLPDLVGDLNRASPPSGPGLLDRPVRLPAPVVGAVVRRFARTGPARSSGWTWRTESAAQVLAPVGAQVDYAGPLEGWGEVVILELGGGDHLVLAGLGSVSTGAGRRVAAGEPVGRMAARRSPAPELYLEVRRDGVPADPARWLDAPP